MKEVERGGLGGRQGQKGRGGRERWEETEREGGRRVGR